MTPSAACVKHRLLRDLPSVVHPVFEHPEEVGLMRRDL